MIKRLILRIIANTGAIYATDYLLDRMTIEGGPKAILLLAVVLTLTNIFVKPLLKIVTLPLVFITGGLFVFVINAFLLYASTLIVPSIIEGANIKIDGISTFFIASVLIAVVSWFEWIFLKPRKKKKKEKVEEQND